MHPKIEEALTEIWQEFCHDNKLPQGDAYETVMGDINNDKLTVKQRNFTYAFVDLWGHAERFSAGNYDNEQE